MSEPLSSRSTRPHARAQRVQGCRGGGMGKLRSQTDRCGATRHLGVAWRCRCIRGRGRTAQANLQSLRRRFVGSRRALPRRLLRRHRHRFHPSGVGGPNIVEWVCHQDRSLGDGRPPPRVPLRRPCASARRGREEGVVVEEDQLSPSLAGADVATFWPPRSMPSCVPRVRSALASSVGRLPIDNTTAASAGLTVVTPHLLQARPSRYSTYPGVHAADG